MSLVEGEEFPEAQRLLEIVDKETRNVTIAIIDEEYEEEEKKEQERDKEHASPCREIQRLQLGRTRWNGETQ